MIFYGNWQQSTIHLLLANVVRELVNVMLNTFVEKSTSVFIISSLCFSTFKLCSVLINVQALCSVVLKCSSFAAFA